MLVLIGALYFVDIFLALNNKTTTLYCCSLFCLLLFVGTDCKSALSVDENNYCTSERLGQINNRLYWKRITPSGLYQSILTEENLILNFIMTTNIKLNELEFKSRVKKICPYVSIKIGYQEKEEFDKLVSNTYFSFQQNIELFGKAKY
jgi:hypothetical protein